MARKKHSAEQIVAILRQIEVEVANHQPTGQACREAGITAPTYYRWRKEYGGLKLEQARRMITNVIFIFSSYVDYAGPAGILGGFRIKVSVGIAVLLASGLLTAQTAEKPKVYVDQTDKFSTAFAAGVDKKQVPVMLVTDPEQARYEVNFSEESNNGSKARGITTAVFTGVYADGSFERVSMKVVDRQSKEIVYSYTCTKGRGGIQPAAECLAKHWKEHLKKN